MKIMFHLGMDIGGTKIEVQVLDKSGTSIYRHRTATHTQSTEALVEQVVLLIRDAEAEVGQPCTLGVGLPGSLDPQSGLLKNSNILSLNQHPVQQLLVQRLQRPITLTNDANCFALSEAMDGAGAGHHCVAGVILGTGCGGGIVIGQQLQQGKNGNSGEWGHVALPGYQQERDGAPHRCYCGQWNCLESFVSGTGITRQLRSEFGESMNGEQFFHDYSLHPTPHSIQWVERFRDQLSRVLAMIVNILDPDIIVLGGGLSNVSPLHSNLADCMSQYTFGRYANTPVVTARHGDSSGVRGAAWLGRNAL